MAGGGLSGTYLSVGSMVIYSSLLNALREALRFLSDISVGTTNVLTVWPGRYGHVEVEGRDGSCVFKEPLTLY